jgi:hypothetical protein
MMGRTAASQACMLTASVERRGTRIVDHGTAGAMVLAGPVVGGGLSSANVSSGGVGSSAAALHCSPRLRVLSHHGKSPSWEINVICHE